MQSDFQKKTSFWESVFFHREIFGVTNFLIVLRICIVNAIIFIKKNISKLIQDQFLQIVKDHQHDYFCYVDKIMPCVFFFKFDLKKCSDPKSENMRLSVLKIRSNSRSRMWDH